MSSVEAAALCECTAGGAAAAARSWVATRSPVPTAGLRFSVIGASTSGVLPATTAGKASCAKAIWQGSGVRRKVRLQVFFSA